MVDCEQCDIVEETESGCILQLFPKAARLFFHNSRENERNANEDGKNYEIKSKLIKF